MARGRDVLVVGSGPLGAAVARRLAERGREVLVLEEGPAISDPPGSHLRNAERFRSDPDAYLDVAVGHLDFFDGSVPRDALPGAAVTKARGGQGVIWTNLCPRGDALWDVLTDEEWARYYGIAERYLGVQGEAFEASMRQRRIRERLSSHLAASRRSIETLPVAAQFDAEDQLIFSAPHDILAGSPTALERVRVARGKVERLLGEGARITGAEVNGEAIAAEEVVIAAGAIATPQILHSSGIRPPALGRFCSYHPIMVAQVVLDEDLCAAPGVPDRVPRLQIPPSEAVEWYTLVLRDVSPFQPEDPDVHIDPNRIVELQFICPVDIEEGKRILFDDDSHPTFQVPLSAADEARLAAAEADAAALTKLLGRTRSGCAPTWMPFGFAHMTGTTRMSAHDDGSGVTDYNGRVWGYDNLRLATNGLIPTRMAVNPTLTGVALAAYTADDITA